jgi:dienelactone hydrolase
MLSELQLSRRQMLALTGSALAGLSRRPAIADDTNLVPTTDQSIRDLADNAPLSMRFKGSTADECRAWQAKFCAKLKSLLGPHTPPAKWKTIVEREVELSDHIRKELVLQADGHPSLPVYLLIPKKKTDKPRPGVLAIHGHGDHGYNPVAGRDDLPGVADSIEKANYDYGRQLVRRGYIVACPCLTPFGRRTEGRDTYGSDPCAVTFVRMQLLGKVLIAENLRDCLWAFELLAQHADVDKDRIGCVGLSYGGRMTMLTSAIETRIKVAVPSGALNLMQERIGVKYSCGAQVIPGLLQYGDVPEVSALIAPRYCCWEIGSKDGLIKPKWATNALQRISRAYRAYDAEDHLLIDRFQGGHRWSGRLAFPLLDKVLQPPA